MKRVFHAISWLLLLPFRPFMYVTSLYRRRIGMQLVVSHVLVVVLSVLVLQIAFFALLFTAVTSLGEDLFIDRSIETFVASTAINLAEDPALLAMDPRSATPALPAADQQRLTASLANLAAATARTPENDGAFRWADLDPRPFSQISQVEKGAIIALDGTVLVSSDPQWLAVGQPVQGATVAAVPQVVQSVLNRMELRADLDGDSAVDTQLLSTVSAYPIETANGPIGVVVLQGDPDYFPSPAAFLLGIALANGVILLFIGLPAMLLAIPFSIWRARRLSSRLDELSETTRLMGQGDLNRRVRVRGHDELAAVSLQFNDMVDRLQRTDNARRAFVSNVSHELRTPVAIIQGNLESLLADDDAKQRDTLELLHRETLGLSRMIDDLFTMARIEESSLPIEALPIDLTTIAFDVVAGIRDVAWAQSKVTLELMVPPGLPSVIGDQTRVRQILGNLIYNAVRHTPEGGLVVVSAEHLEPMVRITVSDTGIGMEPEQVARIFDRFYQVEEARRNTSNAGLGLSIVKQLVEAQGGTIAVTSTPQQGTTFAFTLPVAPKPA